MYKEVYKHLLSSYGRTLGYWFGFATAFIQFSIVRVYVVIIMAQVASNVAEGDFEAAKRHTLVYLIAYICGAAIGTIGELVAVITENRKYGKLLTAFHQKLINKDMLFYQDHQTGYLASGFRQYLDSCLLLVRFWRGEALGAAISLVFPAIVLLLTDWKIGLVAVGILVVQLVYILWASAKAQPYRKISHEVYRKITGEVSDEITNIVAFKSSGVENQAYKIIAELARQETWVYWLRRKVNLLLDLPRSILTALGVSMAVYFIIIGADRGNAASLALIVLTLTYMFQIIRNVSSLPDLIGNHDDLVTKLYPGLEYLGDSYESVRDPVEPKPLIVKQGEIVIDNISFSYPSHGDRATKVPVFKNLSLTVKGGERVGVVGLSGAGKSTLANLLLRFNDVDEGSITIDGIDIRDVEQSILRQHIAYVPQEPLLFHRTVRENIAYYNDEIEDEEVVRAAKAAHAHRFIMELPNSYQTVVGERGVKLSGGQKQRVAIARAILKKAPILIFDEATSALDSESEQIIQRALPEIIGKQTAIVIAHRLSTVAGLDRIIVLDKGRIIEQGSHQQLIALKGRYSSLWQKQTGSS